MPEFCFAHKMAMKAKGKSLVFPFFIGNNLPFVHPHPYFPHFCDSHKTLRKECSSGAIDEITNRNMKKRNYLYLLIILVVE